MREKSKPLPESHNSAHSRDFPTTTIPILTRPSLRQSELQRWSVSRVLLYHVHSRFCWCPRRTPTQNNNWTAKPMTQQHVFWCLRRLILQLIIDASKDTIYCMSPSTLSQFRWIALKRHQHHVSLPDFRGQPLHNVGYHRILMGSVIQNDVHYGDGLHVEEQKRAYILGTINF